MALLCLDIAFFVDFQLLVSESRALVLLRSYGQVYSGLCF